MIHILLWPTRWIDRLRLQLTGQMPVVSGDRVRFGGGIVELSSGDSCHAHHMEDVFKVIWDSGYLADLDRVKEEQAAQTAKQFNLLTNTTDQEPAYENVEPLKSYDANAYL